MLCSLLRYMISKILAMMMGRLRMSGMVVLMNNLFLSLHTIFYLVPSILVAPYVKLWPRSKLGLLS